MDAIVLDVGDEIPGFDLDSQLGRIYFKDLIGGRWSILMIFHSAFEPVATTDLGMLCKLSEEFEARNIFLIALGNDTVPNYRRWIREVDELQSIRINFALLSDPDCKIMKLVRCSSLHFFSHLMSVLCVDVVWMCSRSHCVKKSPAGIVRRLSH
jgi:alkyl hydroperoxide reductase subunit AhpC